MSYLVNNIINEIGTESIKSDHIEKIRRKLMDWLRYFKPSELSNIEKEVRSLRMFIEISSEPAYDANFAMGYLLGIEDVIESLLKSTGDNEDYHLFKSDKNLFTIVYYLYENDQMLSNNKLASKLNINKSIISKTLNSEKVKERKIFICHKTNQYKYYSLSPQGRSLFKRFAEKVSQRNDVISNLSALKNIFHEEQELRDEIDLLQAAFFPTKKLTSKILLYNEQLEWKNPKTRNIIIYSEAKPTAKKIDNNILYSYVNSQK